MNSAKFGEEFTHYLDSFLYTLRIYAGQDIKNEYLNSIKSLKKESLMSGNDALLGEAEPSESDIPYDQLSVTEMANVFDLITLYSKVNKKVIELGKAGEAFMAVTDRLTDIEHLLKKIMLSPRMLTQTLDPSLSSKQNSVMPGSLNNSTAMHASIWQFLEAVSRMHSNNYTHLNRLGISTKMVPEDLNSKSPTVKEENLLVQKLLISAGDASLKMPMLKNDATTSIALD